MNGLMIAIDPGVHTGMAVFEDGRYVRSATFALDGSYNSGGVKGEHGLYIAIHDYVRMHAYRWATAADLVVEGFRSAMPLGSEGLLTVQLIGWCKGIAYMDCHDYHQQLSAVRVPFLEQAARLAKEHGGTRHERDAIAHGLAWLARRNIE